MPSKILIVTLLLTLNVHQKRRHFLRNTLFMGPLITCGFLAVLRRTLTYVSSQINNAYVIPDESYETGKQLLKPKLSLVTF